MGTDIIVAIIAFFGAYCGIFLAKIAKEEVKPGWKHFRLLRKGIFTILALVLLYPVLNSLQWIIPFTIGAILGHVLKKSYLYIGLALVTASTISADMFLLTACLILLYGLPYGTMQPAEITKNLPLFILPLLLWFVPTVLTNYHTILVPFVAGTLFLNE